MRRRLTPGEGWTGVFALVWSVTLAGIGLAYTVLSANADILHLHNGGSVEGRIIEQDEKSYKVRTVLGTVTVPADAVDHIEKKPSLLDEYVELREQTADTPAAQIELAKWCEEHGLRSPWRKHLKRAIELDPDCEPARVALGYVRVAGMWVEGRTVLLRPEGSESRKKTADRHVADNDDEKVVAAIQAQWTVQIRAIKKNKLDSSVDRLQRRGREKIVAIRDPLAILPLTRLLSEGNWACRDALVEVLSHFPQDEATMNLAVLSLVDKDEGIRRRALRELERRNDPRVIPQFREALSRNNDRLIRRAAIGLGMLEAASAVPDLIDVLKAQRRKWVEVSVRYYFGSYATTFDTPTVVALGTAAQIRHSPVLGIESLGPGFVAVGSEYQMRDVTVFRTEVLEALRKITGEDFGFDEAAWRRWYQEQPP
ncbi:MAG: HEAT repeat domain-containing protein [Phycisphaerae bacterium]